MIKTKLIEEFSPHRIDRNGNVYDGDVNIIPSHIGRYGYKRLS